MKHALLCWLLLCVPITAAGQWYAWRDRDGGLHVTDQFATISDDVRSAVQPLAYGRPEPARTPQDAPAATTDPEPAPVRAEIARRAARLATHLAHVTLLRASPGEHSAPQLRLENLLDTEIAAEQAAIAELRRRRAPQGRP